MSKRDNGEPAFPATAPNGNQFSGMTLRDYFAAHAPEIPPDHWWLRYAKDLQSLDQHMDVLTDWAYAYADSMLKQRSK